MERLVKYNVWIHIEGVNEDGDTIQGDDFFEPHKLGAFDTGVEAEEFRDMVEERCGQHCDEPEEDPDAPLEFP